VASRRTPRTSKNAQAASLDIALASSMVPAVSRAAAILRLLGKASEPLGVQGIARTLGIIPSTCLHILRTLMAEEFVNMDETTKLYTLSAGVLTLANRWLTENRFSDIAQPLLTKISASYRVTSIGVQLVGAGHFVVVAIARSEDMIQLHAQIGSRFPVLISATGRCVAAFGNYERAELRRRFKQLRWYSAPSFAAWEAQVAEARSLGYAIDKGNYMAGVTVLSAPVFGIDKMLQGALVIVGITEQLRRFAVDQIARDLREAANQLSIQLGHR
jgi:DNA-binding IclR family transcriptional regulator